MSADAALLPCPICTHTGVFDSVQSLRDRLIHVSTNKILCPVCQEEICGLDKLTIHLFSHVKLLTIKENTTKQNTVEPKGKIKCENGIVPQQRKPRSVAKNKSTSSSSSTPVKFVKIYPKLPVISLNPVPIIDISQRSLEDGIQANESLYVKTETALIPQTNTTCNICGLQFVDINILRMHRCLIHNIDDNSHQDFTRYNCHLCPKNFKMRGSLMVHLRVAHYGFLSGNCNNNNNNNPQNTTEETNLEALQNKTLINDNKQWPCDVCRKCFTTKYFLKKHKRLHTGETPYACTQCNKTFTFQQSYHKHLLYHNDEKPHTCSYCGRAFKELSTLHNHQRIHTGEKPFACETCGKCFRQRVSYLVHRRIHTGVMPYKCTACEKSFRYKVSQRTHKCQAQPPGTVVRQTGDLVEKLRKKHVDPDITKSEPDSNPNKNIAYVEVSEASAELVRTGAKLSLEDMVSENFSIIAETFSTDAIQSASSIACTSVVKNADPSNHNTNQVLKTNFEELIDTIPIEDKNVPSPSEILKNLCLSKDEDFGSPQERRVDLFKDFDVYL